MPQTPPEFALPPLYLVTWVDAMSQPQYDGPPETAGGLCVLHRVGFLVKKTRAYITFAAEIYPDTGDIREPISIPTKWVKSMILLVADEKRRAPRKR